MRPTVFVFDEYLLDSNEKRFQIGGRDVVLPPKVFAVLTSLLEKHGQLVTTDELMRSVWGDTFVEDGNLRHAIHTLRKTFDRDYIETVPRYGYRFRAEVQAYTADEFISQYVEKPVEKNEAIQVSLFKNNRKILLALMTGVLLVTALGFFADFSRSDSDRAGSSQAGEVRYERITASGRAFFAGLSSDHQNVAYTIHTADNKYSLVLHHLPSGSETVVIPPQDIHIFSIQFSPDRKYIYYSGENLERRRAIYRIPLYGGSGQRITDELAHYFSISPDGEWLAFYVRLQGQPETNHLAICRSNDCSELRTVVTRSEGDAFVIWGAAPSWSPDGKKLLAAAYTKNEQGGRAKRHLVEIDVATGEQISIASPEWHGVHQAYWTMDGKEILLLARENPSDPVQIWRLQYPSGEAKRVTNDANDYREFCPASDQSFLIASTWSKSENLFLVPVNEPTAAKQLTFDVSGSNGAWGLKWTPDGRQIVYTKASGYQTGNLWRLDPETMEDVQIIFDKEAVPVSIAVTPDGRSVVFGSNRTGRPHIWQVNLDGTNLRQLTDGESEGHPDISPDGKWVYYGGNGLWKIPVEGGDPVRILEHTPSNPRISPTDPTRFIARYHDANDPDQPSVKLGLFSENDPTRPLVLNIQSKIYEWKPDGSGIYYVDGGESFGNIWFLSLNDPNTVQITNFSDQIISNFSLSPDGSTFAVSRGSAIGNIVRIDLRK